MCHGIILDRALQECDNPSPQQSQVRGKRQRRSGRPTVGEVKGVDVPEGEQRADDGRGEFDRVVHGAAEDALVHHWREAPAH